MDEIERRLGATAGPSHPSPEATARARDAVLTARPRRTTMGADSVLPGGRGRLVGKLASAAIIVAIVVGATFAIVTGPRGGETTTSPPSLPDTVRRCEAPEDGAVVDCVAGAAERRLATPELRDVPWLYFGPPDGQGRMSSEPARQSLTFPPGVSYAEALSEIYVWAVAVGTLPPIAMISPPLSEGVVLLSPDEPGEGIAVDLRAPWGYQAGGEGRIFSPSLATDPGLPPTPRPGELWARGARVDVPSLAGCQVASRRDLAPPPCEPDEVASGPSPRAPALPLMRVDEPLPTAPAMTYVDGPRCRFEPGASGIGRAVVVEADFINFGTAGTAIFTGSVQLAGGDQEIAGTVRREVAAGEEPITVTVRVPLAAGQRVHLFGGRPQCGIDTLAVSAP